MDNYSDNSDDDDIEIAKDSESSCNLQLGYFCGHGLFSREQMLYGL